MALRNSNFLLANGIIGIVLFTAIWFTFRLRRRDQQNSHEFVQAGKIYELFIYPIKSCKPKKVNWLDCGERGSINGEERDRHFLWIDALQDNLFITARVYPKMAHIQSQMLIVQFPSMDEYSTPKLINVDLKEVSRRNRIRRARSWTASQQRQMPLNSSSLHRDLRTEGLDCGDEIGEAFNEFLGVAKSKREFRLIWFANDQLFSERDQSSKGDYWMNNSVPEVNDKIGYSDLASYMAFSLGSLEDLNAHLAGQGIKIDSRNFRPNLIISGLPPFDEDRWLRIRAGEAEFICYKPCTRCIFTTIDPIKGEKCSKMEPLKELRKYRLAPGKLYEQYKDSPILGVNMAIVKTGRVQIGDPVWIQYKPKPF